MDIKPKSTAAEELKAQLEIELKNKKQCGYTSYECTQLSLDGYKFCYKHILQDKNAPYKLCAYVYSSNGKRCQLPAPRSEKKDYGYCNEHALKATLARTKQNAKCPPPNTAEVLLASLSHYIKKPKLRAISNSRQNDEDKTGSEDTDLKNAKYLDPFVDLDAVSIYNGQCNDVLDFGSESESDIEPSTLASVWQDAHGESSEDESADSENEDLLKYANVYTAEEITLITRDKLLRLQALYVEQYRYLQHLLKEKRRKYLHSLKREKETCCNIYSQLRDNPKEQRLYRKLKALNNYHKPHGIDAILNKKVRDIRTRINDGSSSKGHSYTKCIFTEGGVKCGERALPLARHCKKHILEDTAQVLFQPCGKVNGDIECNTPVAAIFDESYCQLHMEIPPLRSYSQVRKDSESDIDDSMDNHPPYPQFMENIKTEYMHYDIPPDIPKMETLPSILFEESSQSMTSDCDQPNESVYETNLSQEDKDVEMKPCYPEKEQLLPFTSDPPTESLEKTLNTLIENDSKSAELLNNEIATEDVKDVEIKSECQILSSMEDLKTENKAILSNMENVEKNEVLESTEEITTGDMSIAENLEAGIHAVDADNLVPKNEEDISKDNMNKDDQVVDQPMEN